MTTQQDSVDMERLQRIRASMALLQQNSEGCARNHYGDDANTFGLPGWLADTRADLEAFTDIIAALSLPITQRDEQGDRWQGIATCDKWRYDFQRPMLAYWTSRGVCETYWHVDEGFDDHPSWWTSPREGWRAPGDQCIPVNQDSVTHWQPMPAPPSIEQGDQDGGTPA